MKTALFRPALAAAMLLPASLVIAATTTASLNVSATVSSSCSISSATALSFPAYTPDGSAQNSTSTLGVKCSNTVPFKIGLDGGVNGGFSTGFRNMKRSGGEETLSYGLYTDVGRNLNWGNTPGTDTVDGVGSGLATEISKTIYGQIPSQPSAVPGNYSDSVTITVTY